VLSDLVAASVQKPRLFEKWADEHEPALASRSRCSVRHDTTRHVHVINMGSSRHAVDEFCAEVALETWSAGLGRRLLGPIPVL